MYNCPSHEPVLVMTSTRIVRTTGKSQRGKRWLHIYGDQSFTDEILLNKDYLLIILTYKVSLLRVSKIILSEDCIENVSGVKWNITS